MSEAKTSQSVHYLILYIPLHIAISIKQVHRSSVALTPRWNIKKRRGKKKNLNARQTSMCSPCVCIYTLIPGEMCCMNQFTFIN